MDLLHEKKKKLEELLGSFGSAAIAFSGGVDSTFLLCEARAVLMERAVAVTVRSESFPSREMREAEEFCRSLKVRHHVLDFRQLEMEEFARNPRNRCYLCKKALFLGIRDFAHSLGLAEVAEGSNVDDAGDYRPGLLALKELAIRSPLKEAGLTKADIRLLSREMNLPTWDKPSYACLATRFVYGENITAERLRMVERAEQFLQDLGFRQERVRIHGGTLARIEVLPEDLREVLRERDVITEKFRSFGFTYVTLDLLGFRTGSMNETLS